MPDMKKALTVLESRVTILLDAYKALQKENQELKNSVVKLTHDLHQSESQVKIFDNNNGASADAADNSEENAKRKEAIDQCIAQVDAVMDMVKDL